MEMEPRFEVASIKAGGSIFSQRPERAGGRFRWTTQVCYLLGYAYGLDFSRVESPMCGTTYAIEATFSPRATESEVRLMVQTLLRERFRMRAHRVTAQVDGWALSLSKPGFRLKPTSPDDQTASSVWTTIPQANVYMVQGRRASIAQLATELQRVLKEPIWDRTGLTGMYNFEFLCASEDLASDVSVAAPSLRTALQETLGLRLEKQKGLLETLAVDEIHEPSEN